METATHFRRRSGLLICVMAAALCAALAASVWFFTVDDAYIVFRYARNLVAGFGPVFNPGDRVEGFSSPLWLAVATLAEAFHLPADHACKSLSLVAVVAMIWFLRRKLRDLSPAACLPVLLLATHAPLVVALVSGLETAVNAVLIVCLLLSAHGTNAHAWRGPALWGTLAILCRPENGMLVGLHGLFLWIARPDQRRTQIAVVALWLAVGSTLTLARLAYYGSPVPNTAAAKLDPGDATWASAWHYVSTWMGRYGWFLLLGVPALATRRTRLLAIHGWLLIAGQLGFVFLAGGDWMPQWRFLLPVSVVLAVLGCYGIDELGSLRLQGGLGSLPVSHGYSWGPLSRSRELLFRPTRRRRRASNPTFRIWVCGAAFALGIVTQIWHFRTDRWALDGYVRALEGLDAGPIRYLADRTSPSDLVVARDVGLLSYRTHCRVLDLVGLTDRHIARTSGLRHRDRIDVGYVFSRHPTYLMLQSERDRTTGDVSLGRLCRRLAQEEQFKQYRLCARWNLPGRHFCEVYERAAPAPQASGSIALSPEE